MGTSSRCVAQRVMGRHDFEVTNFSLLDGMGVNKCVSSSIFSVGGCDWKLNFYPDGIYHDLEAPFASVYLCLVGGPAGEKVKFRFSLLNKGHEVSNITGKRKKGDDEERLFRVKAMTFDEEDDERGPYKFVEKSVLRDLTRVSNDCFTIRCTLCILRVRTEDARAMGVPQANLHQDLARMLRDGEGADVTFKVGDQLFHAHRNILAARSSVFKAELLGASSKGKAEKCIVIADMEPTAFQGLLHFIYTDSLPDEFQADKTVAMQHLLAAAHRYGLCRLRAMCEAKLCTWIDVQTVATTLALAEQHQCVKLKEACLELIGSPHVIAAIMETEGFKNLLSSFPFVTYEILEKVVSARLE